MRLRFLIAVIALLAVIQSCSKNEYLPKPSVQVTAPGRSVSFDALNVGDYGIYELLSNTGGAAEIANASILAGGTGDVNVYAGSAFQKWKITRVAGGYFTIMNVGSTMYAESYNFSGTEALIQAPANTTDAQVWSLVALSSTTYKAINKADGLAATCNGNAVIQLAPFSNLPGQVFGYVGLPKIVTSVIPERRTLVYFGVVDEGDGSMRAEQSDPANYNLWPYVRTHADGYYESFITLDANNHTSTPLANLQRMCAAYTNKNIFFETSTETSVQASGDINNEATDKQYINQVISAGFTVTSTSINYGNTPERVSTLRTYKGARPCLQLDGPWTMGGNINNNSPAFNVTTRENILATDGIALDGPMGLWAGDITGMREGTYSSIQYAHDNGKLAGMILAPSGYFGDPSYSAYYDYLDTSKNCVLGCEDHNDAPDQWHVSPYQPQGNPIFPESTVVNGQNVPVNSLTGVAYWLIRHLNTLPLMQIPNTGAVGNNTTVSLLDSAHARIIMNTKGDTTSSYSMLINFSNSPDRQIELSPDISAAITGSTADWQVTFKIGTTDVTNAVLNTGLNCVSIIRLTSTFILPLTMTVKALNPSAPPVTINFITVANIANTGNKLNYSVVAQTH